MGFNYAKEKRQFDETWKKLWKKYEEAGMAHKDIETMRAYDWEEFCSRRNFENHTQPLPDTYFYDDGEGTHSTLFKKFTALSVSFGVEDFPSRYSWIDTISDTELYSKLSKLSEKDLELLTLYTIDGHTQAEIALFSKRDQSVVSRKINRIINFLKK